MINLLLEALLNKNKSKSKIKEIVILSSFLIVILILFFFSIEIESKFAMLAVVIVSIGFFILCAFLDKRNIKNIKDRFCKYNTELDCLKYILENEFTYQLNEDDESVGNWYSQKQIEYLVQEGESWIASTSSSSKVLNNYSKTIIIPIIAFIVARFSEATPTETLIVIATAVLIIAVFSFGIAKIIADIIDAVFKSGSIYEMQKLINLLKDLLARDFYNHR